MYVVIEESASPNALIADKGTSDEPDRSFFCAVACTTKVQIVSTAPSVRRFRDIDPPNGLMASDHGDVNFGSE